MHPASGNRCIRVLPHVWTGLRKEHFPITTGKATGNHWGREHWPLLLLHAVSPGRACRASTPFVPSPILMSRCHWFVRLGSCSSTLAAALFFSKFLAQSTMPMLLNGYSNYFFTPKLVILTTFWHSELTLYQVLAKKNDVTSI